MATRAQKRTASDPIDGGAPESPVKKATKNKDKSRTPEAQKEAMADALSEANMVAEEGANGDASSKDKGRPRTDRTELLESRKERDEARREAEDLKRRLQKLEEAKIRRELEAATSGKTSEKSSDKSVFTFFSIPYKTRLDTNTFLGSQNPPAVATTRTTTRSRRWTERTERSRRATTTSTMPSTIVLGLSPPFVVPHLFARLRLS